MKLTPEQERAATAAGSVAVTAGAGTGKTSMLAARFLHHVMTDGMSPLSVVAVTFTDKAADELRSRIRRVLHNNLDDKGIAAEVEAAQISTMHALAARICRDFYDLAQIPADFVILDDTEKPLWLAEKFEEAVGEIDPATVDDLGFTWLTSALKVLLRDPYSSERALNLGAAGWRGAINEAREAAIGELTTSDEWLAAILAAHECQGAAGDKLEAVRASVIPLLTKDPDVEELYLALKPFRSNLGAAANWTAGELERLRECFARLKDEVKRSYEWATMEFGPDDEEAARRLGPLAAAFHRVRDFIAGEKLNEKVLDFTDLEQYAVKILENQEAIDHYKQRWRAFLVDEFQDTNPIQAEILARLTRDAVLTIVGDEKQAIYGFRGADIGVFSRVRKQIVELRGGNQIPLSRTFRAHHELVVSMNTMFEPVLGDLHQPLEADRQEPPYDGPHIHSAFVEAQPGPNKSHLQMIEARYIADRIKDLSHAGVAYKDIAILARRWDPLDVYLDVLTSSGVPAVHAGGGSLLETREAKDAYSLLSFLVEPNDDVPLVAILRSPFFAISDRVLYDASLNLQKGMSWWQLISDVPVFEQPVAVLREMLDARSSHSAGQLFRLADRLTGYGAIVSNLPHGSRRAADLRGIQELFRKLEKKGKGDIFGTTRYLKELIATETEIPRPPLEIGEAVALMSIHKSKGLEWPIVFVPDLAHRPRSDNSQIMIDTELGVSFKMDGDAYDRSEPSIFKLIKARKERREKDEARRLLYVAITRARDKVFLTATTEGGNDLQILRPGLDAAGIVSQAIPFEPDRAVAPNPVEQPPFAMPERSNVAPVSIGLKDLPVTALSVFDKCPLRFKFQYVDGHPGLSRSFGSAMVIGSLAHKALELGLDSVAALRRESPEASDAQLNEALGLVYRFRTDSVYEDVRSEECTREIPFVTTLEGIRLHGIADLLGPNFVLDFKTDSEIRPDEHRFQLWAYAEAFGASTAYIAYLRHGVLHEFRPEALKQVSLAAKELLGRISNAEYSPNPSIQNCGYCSYQSICSARV